MTPSAAPELAGRLEYTLWRCCDHLLMHHTNPWELDEALMAWGFARGPCEVQDHVGLDAVRLQLGDAASPILPRMLAEGRLGKIGGVGFFRYPGGGGAVVDPLIEDLILEEAHFAKVSRVPLSDTQIVSKVCEDLRTALNGLTADEGQRREMVKMVVERLCFPACKTGDLM
jgi:3-hydroxyacyl-CoA dehydrogenase